MAGGRIDSIGAIDIAISGLRAESKRMDVIANNIANARTSRTETGEPYRRKELVVATESDWLAGVRVEDIVNDTKSSFQNVLMPGHPDADSEGYVEMPNVSLPREMIDMVTASRAYQANAAILKRYQRNVDVTLELLR